jgi:hypothetical protein
MMEVIEMYSLFKGITFWTITSLIGATPLYAADQPVHTPGYTIKLLNLKQEAGLTYQPSATATFACSIYDWAKKVNWGDGGGVENLTHKVAAQPGGATSPGTYDLFSTHSYAHPGDFTATAELWVGCPGVYGVLLEDQETFTVKVFERKPIKTFSAASQNVKKGQPVDLTISLFLVAPESGTRIALTTDKPVGVFQSFPAYVVVPDTSTDLKFTISTLPNAMSGPVTIWAIGVDGSHMVSLNIQ